MAPRVVWAVVMAGSQTVDAEEVAEMAWVFEAGLAVAVEVRDAVVYAEAAAGVDLEAVAWSLVGAVGERMQLAWKTVGYPAS